MNAGQAAAQLGVLRGTYSKWEQRGLGALLAGLDYQSPGRIYQAVDSQEAGVGKTTGAGPRGQCFA